jgi:hypothetical protein
MSDENNSYEVFLIRLLSYYFVITKVTKLLH